MLPDNAPRIPVTEKLCPDLAIAYSGNFLRTWRYFLRVFYAYWWMDFLIPKKSV